MLLPLFPPLPSLPSPPPFSHPIPYSRPVPCSRRTLLKFRSLCEFTSITHSSGVPVCVCACVCARSLCGVCGHCRQKRHPFENAPLPYPGELTGRSLHRLFLLVNKESNLVCLAVCVHLRLCSMYSLCMCVCVHIMCEYMSMRVHVHFVRMYVRVPVCV